MTYERGSRPLCICIGFLRAHFSRQREARRHHGRMAQCGGHRLELVPQGALSAPLAQLAYSAPRAPARTQGFAGSWCNHERQPAAVISAKLFALLASVLLCTPLLLLRPLLLALLALASTAAFFVTVAAEPTTAAARDAQVAATLTSLSTQPAPGTPDCAATARTASSTPLSQRAKTSPAAAQLPFGHTAGKQGRNAHRRSAFARARSATSAEHSPCDTADTGTQCYLFPGQTIGDFFLVDQDDYSSD